MVTAFARRRLRRFGILLRRLLEEEHQSFTAL
jgi:hypothetical protein